MPVSTQNENPVLKAALDYYNRGWGVIPVKAGTKRPAVKSWKQFQSQRPSKEQVDHWFSSGKYGIGILCGPVSGGLTVVDFDKPDHYRTWAESNPDLACKMPTVETGRGFHVYLRTDLRKSLQLDGIDVKASGYVLAPPSVHPTGAVYCWTVPLNGELMMSTMEDLQLKSCKLSTRATSTTENPKILKYHSDIQYSKEVAVGDEVSLDEDVRLTLPEKPGQRNKCIFKLAVLLRGRFGTCDEARPIVELWHKAALPVIQTKDFGITWLDFSGSWRKVKFPAGSGPLGQAERAARSRVQPGEDYVIRLLLEVCFELSKMNEDGIFFLSNRDAGRIIGASHVTGGNAMYEIQEQGYIELIEKGRREGCKASVYRWKGKR